MPGLTRTEAGEPGSTGEPSLQILHPFATVTIERCVLGPIVAVDGATVSVKDSIIDADTPEGVAYAGDAAFGAALRLDDSTVIGRVRATRVDISNSLVVARLPEPPAANDGWPGPVWRSGADQLRPVQRYAAESRVPRRYRVEPTQPSHRPHFTSLRYGDPGYAPLQTSTPDTIRHRRRRRERDGRHPYLHQPQRETNLRLRLDEYLPFDLEAGFIYAS